MKHGKPKPKAVLPPDAAIDAAQRAIQETGMREWPQCAILKNPAIIPQDAWLTNETSETDGEPDTKSYIVPYGFKGEQDLSGVWITRLCILIDAVTGEFEEVATFGKPVQYLPRDAAIRVLASALRQPVDRLEIGDASLMFRSCEITHLRAYPFWRIAAEGRLYYVAQEGKLYSEIPQGKSGS